MRDCARVLRTKKKQRFIPQQLQRQIPVPVEDDSSKEVSRRFHPHEEPIQDHFTSARQSEMTPHQHSNQRRTGTSLWSVLLAYMAYREPYIAIGLQSTDRFGSKNPVRDEVKNHSDSRAIHQQKPSGPFQGHQKLIRINKYSLG